MLHRASSSFDAFAARAVAIRAAITSSFFLDFLMFTL
jgi:hypothetical protein